jgi:hypothetical protein
MSPVISLFFFKMRISIMSPVINENIGHILGDILTCVVNEYIGHAPSDILTCYKWGSCDVIVVPSLVINEDHVMSLWYPHLL